MKSAMDGDFYFIENTPLFIKVGPGFNKNHDDIEIQAYGNTELRLKIVLKRKELKKLFIAIRERLKGEYSSVHFTGDGKFILHPPGSNDIIEKRTEETLKALKV